jgi:hypothetical protein
MKWTVTAGPFFFRPRTSTRRKTIWAGRHCLGSVLGRPDSTPAYGPYGLGRPATFSGGRPP